MIKRLRSTPMAAIVAIALVVFGILAVLTGSIAGSYLLMEHYVTSLQASQQHAQAAQSVKLCKSILQMDQASHGAKFATNDADQYGRRLSGAIHQLYTSTNCQQILYKK